MTQKETRLLLSSALILNQTAKLTNIVDHNPKTAIENVNHLLLLNTSSQNISKNFQKGWDFQWKFPFIQMDVGLSHFPGNPPQANPLRSFKIWPGDQSSQESWEKSARPKDIRLVFFRQRLVDSDREYKMIGTPISWQTFSFRLQNKFGSQNFGLEFKNKVKPSSPFPGEIDLIWCRMEIISHYTGKSQYKKNNIAISEIEFHFTKQYRERI